ncbi:MAG: aspartate-semialdehyde dehydrogenase [Myxococcota bacterium]
MQVAVVGATGLAGQQFLTALSGHPTFEITRLAASPRSAGKSYIDAIRNESGQIQWYADEPLDDALAGIEVEAADKLDPGSVDVVFTAIESGPARELEPKYAQVCPVISTASAFRYEDDVPLLLPGVNMAQAALLRRQREQRGWKGFVAPNPNCTTVGLAIALAPLHRAFGVEHVHMVSLQAVSGAGRSPGVIALDVVDNVVPFIPKEEDKVALETRKILGTLSADGDRIVPATFGVSATCTRIGVLEGHTEVVHVKLSRDADEAAVIAAWREFGAGFRAAGYPSCPPALIHVHDDPFRPQVRLDRDYGDGMTTVIGRVRRDPTVDNGWKFMLVSHNTKMGAARGCVLVAEHLAAEGYLR